MTSPDGQVEAPDDEQVAEIMREVWAAYPDIALEPVPGAPAWPGGGLAGAGLAGAGMDGAGLADAGLAGAGLAGAVVTATVRILGAWRGCVVLTTPEPLARAAAAAMLGVRTEQLSRADVADAVGELANVVAGNLKSLLPAPSTLSLPAVAAGLVLPAPGAALLNDVLLTGPAGSVALTVWRQG